MKTGKVIVDQGQIDELETGKVEENQGEHEDGGKKRNSAKNVRLRGRTEDIVKI